MDHLTALRATTINTNEETYVDHPLNHISLCAGYGGIDLGLERVLPACRAVAYVEIEAFAIANLVSKMEAGELAPAPVWTDLHTFPFEQFHGVVDIITAGFPCQPFSQAGARRGVEDKRHLWPRIAEGIRRSRPALVFMENVDGIVTAKSPGHHSVLQHVLGDLEGMGYRATAGLYTAQEVGSPHVRKRWFILGLRDSNSDGQPDEPLDDEASRVQSDLADAHGSYDARSTTFRVQQKHAATCSHGTTAGELADANGGLSDPAREEVLAGRDSSDSSDREGTELADTYLEGLEGPRHEGAAPERRERRAELADTDNSRGWEDQQPSEQGADRTQQSPIDSGHLRTRAPEQVTRWPAGPGQEQHHWEEPRTTQPGVGGAPDGSASGVDPALHRVDRLRLLGNGVVPDQAARAFHDLLTELTSTNPNH